MFRPHEPHAMFQCRVVSAGMLSPTRTVSVVPTICTVLILILSPRWVHSSLFPLPPSEQRSPNTAKRLLGNQIPRLADPLRRLQNRPLNRLQRLNQLPPLIPDPIPRTH